LRPIRARRQTRYADHAGLCQDVARPLPGRAGTRFAIARPSFMNRIDISRTALREPGVSDPRHYARRVHWLAVVHPSLFLCSLVGFTLLIWRGEFFVTLSQRSNVETLTIAFFLLYFGYFAVVTFQGAVGGVRIAVFHLRARVQRDRRSLEARRIAALGPRGQGPSA